MANTIQTGPYEILLRYNCERGEAFGHLRGCHRVMASYMVDDTGNIVGSVDTGEKASDFPPDELVKYLGEQFAGFNAQLEAAKVAADEAKTEGDSLRISLAGKTKDLDSATNANVGLRESLSVAEQELKKATEDLELLKKWTS